MTPKANYLDQIVYLRKATNLVVPATEANKKDPNLVPMTVGEAIKLGYIKDPMQNVKMEPLEKQLLDENTRLKEALDRLDTQQQEQQAEMHKLRAKLVDAEAISENKVSIGGVTGIVIPPSDEDAILNLAEDAELEGEVLDAEESDKETQAALDALVGTTG